MKRSLNTTSRGPKGVSKRRRKEILTSTQIEDWQETFDADPTNKVARNAIVTVGSDWAATDLDEARKIDHIFINSIKVPDTYATNQMYSGRCWIFAGLNTFRHLVMNALCMDDFEFSQTYLFFYDKLEKSNMFLKQMIDYRNVPFDMNDWTNPDSRYVGALVTEPVSDGGYWNMFANLVDKYGLVPKSAMPETFQSEDSGAMNDEINHRLRTWACLIREKYTELTDVELHSMRKEWVRQIHGILVKYLGPPPKDFQFSFRRKHSFADDLDDDEVDNHIAYVLKTKEGKRFPRMTPMEFKNLLLPDVSLSKDFVVLGNYPRICPETARSEWNNCYEIEHTTNVEGGEPMKLYNMATTDLKDFTAASITAGQPVWFAADVGKGFNHYHSALDDKLLVTDTVFGPLEKIDKGQRLAYLDSYGNHAMSFTGVDYDEETEEPMKWQVENSWGFWHSGTPGLDGFLYMADDWFTENVFQVVIYRKIIEESGHSRMLNKAPIVLKPWDAAAKAMTSLKDSQVTPKKPQPHNSHHIIQNRPF